MKSPEVYILGMGGHGQVVLDTLLSSNIQVTGVFDRKLSVGDQVFGVSVVDEVLCLQNVTHKKILLVMGLGANPYVFSRQRLFNTMKDKGYSFLSLQHPSVVIGRECIFGEATQIMAGAIIQARVTLEDNVVINTGASIDHNCTISAHSFISPGVTLCGGVIIEESSFIGAGAIVMPGITIGRNAIVGAGAVVNKSVENGCIVANNPAVKIGMNNYGS